MGLGIETTQALPLGVEATLSPLAEYMTTLKVTKREIESSLALRPCPSRTVPLRMGRLSLGILPMCHSTSLVMGSYTTP